MPRNEHLILCGGAEALPGDGGTRHRLDLHGKARNMHLKISDISDRLLANVPQVLADLLDVACYVYAADGVIGRGGKTDAQMGAWWRRQLHFVIPVRRPELWTSNAVTTALVETLTFLSDDSYEFEFRAMDDPPATEEYFDLAGRPDSAFTPDEVILFSGGLDSLAGAIAKLAEDGSKVALVSHRSSPKIFGAQKYLVDRLQAKFGRDRVMHIPIWAQLDGISSRETTHRTRSFLFAALGAVTAQLFGLDRMHFFENGIVSLNLPVSGQVVGARATRTTHPLALQGFHRLFTEVLGCDFGIDNPFAWKTKAEIVERISTNRCGDLIRHSRSCTRVHAMTKLHPHCGECSQCIDRRFAVFVAGKEGEDPADAYKVDLFTGERSAGPDREMALAYVQSATDINKLEDVAFFTRFGEVSRIVGCFDEPADIIGQRVLDLHRRHAAGVCRAFDEAIRSLASELREGALASDCLLSLIASRHVGPVTHVLSQTEPAEDSVTGKQIRIAIDEYRRRIVFGTGGEIKGVGAELLIALSGPFRDAAHEEKAPENYPYIESGELRRLIHCDDEDTFRRRILRCRREIGRLAEGADDAAPAFDAVIESLQRHGYRLNPDRVRIVALSELLSKD